MRFLVPVLFAGSALSAGSPPARPSPYAPQVVVVHAKDFAFVGPKSVKSGATTFRLVNDGKTLHHLALFRLQKGKTMADFVAFMKKPGPPFGWFTEVGGPNPAVPGASIEATMTLTPGDYVIACLVPSAGETAPHLIKGMVAPLTVTTQKSEGVAPPADIVLKTSDYKFSLSKPITKGHHVFEVQNDAPQAHEVIVVQLGPGKKVADVARWVDVDLMKGPPPGRPVGGMAAIAKGQTATFPMDFTPGNYGFICFAPDAKDGKSHSVHGMLQEFVVQ